MTPARTDKLYLVGFMGSGKSTLARALGRRLSWRAIDLDEEIERREGRTVSQVFAKEGEAYFRKVEREVLLALQPMRNVIIATGGRPSKGGIEGEHLAVTTWDMLTGAFQPAEHILVYDGTGQHHAPSTAEFLAVCETLAGSDRSH